MAILLLFPVEEKLLYSEFNSSPEHSVSRRLQNSADPEVFIQALFKQAAQA